MSEPCFRTVEGRATGLLALAAAPTFAAMAVLTAVSDSVSPAPICASSMPMNGMVVMYALMSAFHITPWLRLKRSKSAAVSKPA